MQTLPAYRSYLSQQYAPKTVRMYWGDVRELSLYLRDKHLQEIRPLDLQQWVATLLDPAGRHLEHRTLNRKRSAVINYFAWLRGIEAITDDPAAGLMNARVQSPLPDYLYDSDVQVLQQAASKDPRTYLLVLLFLESGIKSQELLTLTRSHVDISNTYKPELWIKHNGKATKKDRKVALTPDFTAVYLDYIDRYKIEGALFPFSGRYVRLLFAHLKKLTGIQKTLTPKTLRHTHVVRAYERGEDPQRIFDRIGLAPDSRIEADEMYSRLARRGI
jgi:site-specific recombinase XerD